MSASGQRMDEGRQPRGAASGKRLRLPRRRRSPGRLPGGSGGGTRAQSPLLRLLVHAWLWAASCASAQVFNLSLSVDEGLPPDTLVGDIRAGLPLEQQQEGGGFFLSEDSEDSPLLDAFHVHPDTGIIRTARCLDREERDHYGFVAATLLGAVVQVEIRVNDVNDHSPRFPRDSLQLDVSERSPPGTAFRLPGAHDPDAGSFSTQGYTLRQLSDFPGDPAGPYFQLRYGTAGPSLLPRLGSSSPLEPLDLVLLRRLDREAAAAHKLQIEAWDGGHPPLTGRLRVELHVLDENDNPPVFEQAEYRAAVREDAPPGAEVCHVRATDPDLGPNGQVRYRLHARQAPGPGGEPLGDAAFFEVEELSGAVRVRRPLDREAQAWHQLVIEARDGGAEPEVATVRVSIVVLDVNDNRPAIHLLFLTEDGAARVSEGARPGDYVARVSVSDADGVQENGEEAAGEVNVGLGGGDISLSLEGGEGAFALRPGGPPGVFFLYVQEHLDREKRDLYELRLVAMDTGSPPLSTEEILLLRVADLNDQPPLCSQEHYGASVSEAAAPGTVVLWVSASDADEPGTDSAQLHYALVQPLTRCSPGSLSPSVGCGPYFTIDPESGVISTLRTLDREVQERVELKVVAQDLGEPPLTATCLVSITVDDVNDNEPIFQKQVYNVTLAEHAPVGYCFLQLKASDADAGLYGFVEYSLYDGFQSDKAPQAFQINPNDGQICVSQDIDKEKDPAAYDLLVKAKDGGGLSAQAFVRVEVEDVNDNRPVFNPSAYVTSISGQTQPGTEIINTLATDRDSGVYGTVAYELIPGDQSSLFVIDSTTGIIYLASTLSSLESTTLSLVVCARDGGGLTSATNAEVTVHILPTTLVAAEFERPKYTFAVSEDVREGSPIGTVRAREPLNSTEPIFYRITSGDLDGKFSIHPRLGSICTQKRLDHETQSVFVLTVQAQVNNSPVCSSTEVNITVLDINDNHPALLTASDEIRVPQRTPPGTALYFTRAEDKDGGLNGFIQYSIASQTSGIFTIDPGLGVVYLNESLGGDLPQEYTVTIMAEDQGIPSLASQLVLTVVIEEQETSPPLTFENLVYQVEISEALSPTTQLLQIQAHVHGPQHTSSQLSYALQPSLDSAPFGISVYTGWVYLRSQLDYESKRTYNFRAFAWIPEDGVLRSVSTSVIVHVLDENDNTPAFLHTVLFWQVKESPLPQGAIGQVTAVDSDSGKNGQLSYFLLSAGNFFKVNPNTGELINWVALDHEHRGHHHVTVLVTDHGSPPRNSTTVIYISVTDINDNEPRFPQCGPGKELHIKVLEGQPVNMLVTTVFAKDLDEGSNGEVTYSVSSGDSFDHFKIDANSGEIRTTTRLSYAYSPSYRMTVIASDQGLPPLQGQAIINIQVIPQSKGKAIRSQNIRHLVIPENLKPAKIMSLIKSPDHLQQYHSGKFQFCILAADRDDHFEVDSSTGDLVLSKELDYELTSHYLFRVVTNDNSKSPPLSSTVFLSVDVEDQNDHAPSFQDEFIVISVEENASVGSLVYVFNAKDGDGSFLNSRVQYFMEAHHPGTNPFLIHPTLGTLVTASLLDRESVPTVILKVTASDQAVNVTDRRLKSLIAKIVILDVNDHSPAFMSSPLAHVEEDAAVGSVVHHITADDPDEGRNGKVTYTILSGNENMAFLLDESTGILTSAFPLDHEIKSQYLLTTLAQDDGVPALSSSQTLTITVLDVNDEAPAFTQPLYNASVKENKNPGEFVTRVEAMDRDSGINSKLQFEIMPGASFGLFEINPDTGEVVTTTTLDREVQDVFTLRVLVRDGGFPSLSSTTMILCTVEDENDHAPEYIALQHYIEVPENQGPEVIYTIWASDMDTGNNGAVEYHIVDGNTAEYFAINETSGELSTTRPLDREQVHNFSLVILCSDLGDPPRSSMMQLQVRVLDANDHSPSFPMLHYQSSVREDAEIGTTVLVLSATDEDEGLNGNIEYILVDEAFGAFSIDPVTGTLRTARALDREARSQHVFWAVARDCSVQSSRSATVSMHISITDVNDNDPVWEQNPFDIFLPPELPVHVTIATLRAEDPDLGLNGTVTFNVAETKSALSINKYTGEIQLLQRPPSEYFPLWVQLKAMDQGIPPRTATGLLAIHMEEEEVKLSFTQPVYKGIVTENCEAGTSVVTVKAFTADSSEDSIKYLIFSGNEDGAFSLCSNSGELTVKEPKFLDFEVRNNVQLIVLAEGGGHRAYSKLSVMIQDVNDNVPCFEQSVYKASVSEGQFPNAHIIQVSATDPDGGLNGLLKYSIISGNQGDMFQIDDLSGVITTNGMMDYESTSSYSFLVQATDAGVPQLSATSVVRIQVTDINDNAPVFLPSKAVEVAENSLPGVIVTRVSVHDVDLDPAFIFSFTKENNPGTKFAIDQNTGIVRLVEALDFEEAIEYELLVQVSDSLHNTEGILTVHVVDVNDNPPVFSQDFYQVPVPESVPVGYPVLTVTATDLDSSTNLSYRILSSSEEFSIDPMNGTIFTIHPVRLLNEISSIRFLVEASDGGAPELRALALVEIEIQDVNNHPPEFTVEHYNLSLSEDTFIGSTLVTFSTFDHDWTRENTRVDYSIISGNSQKHFHVETSFMHPENPYTQVGHLVLLLNLDREATPNHQLVVLASDHGYPPLSSTAIISIEVLDVNDNPPKFTHAEYDVHIKESTPIGSHISVVSADDCDLGSNAEIIYHIISGNERGNFQLEEKTGILYLIKPLDYEETIKFTLTVQASDKAKKHFSFAIVLVNILDENDHTPWFMFPRVECVVPENLPVSSPVCSVNALDLDTGPYGELTYSLLSPCFSTHGQAHDHHHDLFLIDPFTGDIYAKQILDYELKNKYCITVEAKDRGDLTASLMVWVDIEGIDEFEPIFTQDQYFFNLPDKSKVRQLIGRVEASDADAGIDGVILYSLGTSSPFFSVNKTNGNIYLTRALPHIKNPVSREDTIEMNVIAHSPKQDSKFASCTVFVNVSFSPEGKRSTIMANRLSVSLMASFPVLLLLVLILMILILRHKQKDSIGNYEEKKTSSSLEVNLRLTRDSSMLKALPQMNDCNNEVMPVNSMPEWLGLISIMEEELLHLCSHSNSSGHCSVEGETAEDKEIQRINEHPYRKASGSVLKDLDSRVPDSGIPRDSDQLSYLSGETDLIVTVDKAENSHLLEEGGREGHGIAYVQNDVFPHIFQRRVSKEGILADAREEYILNPGEHEARGTAPSTDRTPDHFVRVSGSWNHLLGWEPKFQSLASVFNDIAKLKDEHLHIPVVPKGKKSFVFPPPLITAVAQPGIKAVLPRMPTITPGQVLQEDPCPPVLYHLTSLPEAVTPSLSPALSLLTTQTPAMSPLLSMSEFLGTHTRGTCHGQKAEDEI